MNENYIISIIGTQTVNDNDETIELVTSASINEKNGKIYIKYKEYDLDNGSSYVSNTIKIEGSSKITLIKKSPSGTCNQLVLESGVRHQCLYSTPIGSMTIGIYTDLISFDINENGGTIEIDYTIDFNSDVQSDNHMMMILRKKGEKENV